VTPDVVREWKQSAHSDPANAVSCSVCHGTEHSSMQDISQARPVPARVCRTCHEQQYVQFSRSKHAQAWDIMRAWPGFHYASQDPDSDRNCALCHSVGFKPDQEIARLRDAGSPTGAAACGNCHGDHAYSLQEAAQPEACVPCHQGQATPQMEAFSGSPHGRLLPVPDSEGRGQDESHIPTCQTCHFPNQSHTPQTVRGSLGLGLPLPEAPKWAGARKTILRGLGLIGLQGQSGDRPSLLAEYKLMPLTKARREFRRGRMQGICIQCHDTDLVLSEFEHMDTTLRRADILVAEALDIVSRMGRNGRLGRSAKAGYSPDIGRFDPESHPAEQTVYRMFHTLRKKAWQGAAHGNQEMAREGLQEMQQAVAKLRAMESGE
jgi:hypothetical protein